MLRPSSTSFLGSTRKVRARNLRKERVRALGQSLAAVGGLGAGLLVGSVGLLLPLLLPLLYLASAFLFLALPLRWLLGTEPLGLLHLGLWAVSLVVSVVGVFRANQQAEPLAPVRPAFARGMLVAAWLGALLLAIADQIR